jgi:hypothetical protein
MVPAVENNGRQQYNEKDGRVKGEDRFGHVARHFGRIVGHQMKEASGDHSNKNDHGRLWQILRHLGTIMKAFLRDKKCMSGDDDDDDDRSIRGTSRVPYRQVDRQQVQTEVDRDEKADSPIRVVP